MSNDLEKAFKSWRVKTFSAFRLIVFLWCFCFSLDSSVEKGYFYKYKISLLHSLEKNFFFLWILMFVWTTM